MQELIYKQEAHDKLKSMYLKIEAERGHNDVANGLRIACKAIGEIKEVDTEPVRHGRWIDPESETIGKYRDDGCVAYYTCSGCKEISKTDYDFCPNCGARMDATDTNVGGKMGGADNEHHV